MIVKINLPTSKKHKLNHRHKLKDFNLKFNSFNLFTKRCFFVSKNKGYLTLKQILFFKIFFKKIKLLKKKVRIITPLMVNYNPTKRSERSRMGKGKGKNTIFWFIPVRYGTILFEFIILKKKINIIVLKRIIHEFNKRLPLKIDLKLFNIK